MNWFQNVICIVSSYFNVTWFLVVFKNCAQDEILSNTEAVAYNLFSNKRTKLTSEQS